MISNKIINKARELKELGCNYNEISKELGISRSAIRDNLTNKVKSRHTHNDNPLDILNNEDNQKHYAYILGLYYGDGHISKYERVYRLRIFLGRHETDVQEMAIMALKSLFPNNKISSYSDKSSKMDIISTYSKNLINFFPDHGEGIKSNRKLDLTLWQNEIVDKYKNFFITGLYDSDGCGYYDKGYLRYSFTNTSHDLNNMFKKYVNVNFNEYKIKSNSNISGRYINSKDRSHVRISQMDSVLTFQKNINNVYSFYKSTIDVNEYKIKYVGNSPKLKYEKSEDF